MSNHLQKMVDSKVERRLFMLRKQGDSKNKNLKNDWASFLETFHSRLGLRRRLPHTRKANNSFWDLGVVNFRCDLLAIWGRGAQVRISPFPSKIASFIALLHSNSSPVNIRWAVTPCSFVTQKGTYKGSPRIVCCVRPPRNRPWLTKCVREIAPG